MQILVLYICFRRRKNAFDKRVVEQVENNFHSFCEYYKNKPIYKVFSEECCCRTGNVSIIKSLLSKIKKGMDSF